MSVKGNSEELAECAMYGEYPRVEQLLQEGYSANSLMEPGFPALCNAAHTGNVDMMRLLISHGADPSMPTFTQAVPAWVACEANAVECLRIIAENRGDLNSPSRDGQTPGMAAAMKGHIECIKILAQYGANLAHRPADGEFQGRGALELAQENGHTSVVQFLMTGQ